MKSVYAKAAVATSEAPGEGPRIHLPGARRVSRAFAALGGAPAVASEIEQIAA
jgi:hypothetical protein